MLSHERAFGRAVVMMAASDGDLLRADIATSLPALA